MRFADDKKRRACGMSPNLTDNELEEIVAILKGENEDPNAVAAL